MSEKIKKFLNKDFFQKQRWFLKKMMKIRDINLIDSFRFKDITLNFMGVEYEGYDRFEIYFIPLKMKSEETFTDALQDTEYYINIRNNMNNGAEKKTKNGKLDFSMISRPIPEIKECVPFEGELSNSVVILDKKYVVKTYRRLQAGLNPDFEILRALVSKKNEAHVPELFGYCSYTDNNNNEHLICIVQEFIPSVSNAWEYVLKQFKNPGNYKNFLAHMNNLGATIADLHYELFNAFGSDKMVKDDMKKWYDSLIDSAEDVLDKAKSIPQAKEFVANRQKILDLAKKIYQIKDMGRKIRVHNDLHLGQILAGTGVKNSEPIFYIIDFEGEPLKTYAQVREKQSPLKDIAGMLRSFNYAVNQSPTGNGMDAAEWEKGVCDSFLAGYRDRSAQKSANYLPADEESFKALLALLKLEKAIYEIDYEISSRPDWVRIPLQGILRCLKDLE